MPWQSLQTAWFAEISVAARVAVPVRRRAPAVKAGGAAAPPVMSGRASVPAFVFHAVQSRRGEAASAVTAGALAAVRRRAVRVPLAAPGADAGELVGVAAGEARRAGRRRAVGEADVRVEHHAGGVDRPVGVRRCVAAPWQVVQTAVLPPPL